MGIVIQPGLAMVVGYHNEDNDLGHGIQINNERSIHIGTWHGEIPWDVDIYHKNALGEDMFSQFRDGTSLPKDKVRSVQLQNNPRFLPMKKENNFQISTFENKVSTLLRKVSSRC